MGKAQQWWQWDKYCTRHTNDKTAVDKLELSRAYLVYKRMWNISVGLLGIPGHFVLFFIPPMCK